MLACLIGGQDKSAVLAVVVEATAPITRFLLFIPPPQPMVI